MLMVIPNEWRDPANNQPTIHRPIALISGNRLTAFSSTDSVYALQRAGMPLREIHVQDYIRALYQYPGPNGQPNHIIPSSYNGYIPT